MGMRQYIHVYLIPICSSSLFKNVLSSLNQFGSDSILNNNGMKNEWPETENALHVHVFNLFTATNTLQGTTYRFFFILLDYECHKT